MKLLDSLSIIHGEEERKISLYQGDLASLSENEAVDILVVSALPGDYTPTFGSLIGAIHNKGVSVAQLAENKLMDLRTISSCWLSQK